MKVKKRKEERVGISGAISRQYESVSKVQSFITENIESSYRAFIKTKIASF